MPPKVPITMIASKTLPIWKWRLANCPLINCLRASGSAVRVRLALMPKNMP